MKKLGMKLLVIMLTILVYAKIFDGITIESYVAVFGFSLILSLINMTIKPILMLLSLPVTIITVGIFALIINAWMIMLADHITGGVSVSGFWLSMLIAVTISILNSMFVKKSKWKEVFSD